MQPAANCFRPSYHDGLLVGMALIRIRQEAVERDEEIFRVALLLLLLVMRLMISR
jgi:hypothetical protein